ncbi:MAG TPA: hypothetical protein VLF59_02890, partial [Candidatus Saccharimonadales bacterium]|nr:hypothetical protein [Candidatus Saccharimonadales bacterium]
VNPIEVRASDDILDERANPIAQQFDNMMSAAASKHRQQIMAQMESPAPAQPPQQPAATYAQPSTPPNYWFMQPPPTTPGQAQFLDAPVVTPVTPTGIPAAIPGATPGPQAAAPTPEEEALIAKFKEENSLSTVATSHLKTVKTPEQLAAEAARAKAAAAVAQTKPAVTAQDQAAIINLANNDDLDIATLARQAKREVEDDGEVVISLR